MVRAFLFVFSRSTHYLSPILPPPRTHILEGGEEERKAGSDRERRGGVDSKAKKVVSTEEIIVALARPVQAADATVRAPVAATPATSALVALRGLLSALCGAPHGSLRESRSHEVLALLAVRIPATDESLRA